MLALATPTLAAGTLRVSSSSWEVAQAENLHKVAAGGKLSYCVSQPASALTPLIAYKKAPVGKSYALQMAGPSASGTVPFGVKTPISKSSGRVSLTYATPSFPKHTIAPGKYTFSMRIGKKTVASLKLTLVAKPGC